MTFVSYYTDLLAGGSIGGYIALGIVAVALLIVVAQAFLAFGRGTSRSAMRLIVSVFTAALAFFITRLIGRAFFADATLGEYLPLSAESLRPLLDAKLSLVVLPLLFVLIYLLLTPLTLILHKLLCGVLGFSYHHNNLFTRLFAMVIGVLQGALFALILFFPLLNLGAIYGDAVEEGKADASACAVYEDYLEATDQSPLVEYTMQFGGEWLRSEFAAATTAALPKE